MKVLVADTWNRVGGPMVEDFPFNSHDAKAYAILSHRWGLPDEEVSYRDIQSGMAREKASFKKIQYTCQQAIKHNLRYVWIDTCCIDKESSAELQEAINSMFEWYRKAEVCYAYLEDVSNDGTGLQTSTWFSRGWTLQELLAPRDLRFYSKDWSLVGDKKHLHGQLAEITNIDCDILTGNRDFRQESIAKRMSWAANRETSRPEDMAYSLMGIFNVYMPMIYGEGGARAFLRLQEEIIKSSNDESIFAWIDSSESVTDEQWRGLLAETPLNFAQCSKVVSRNNSTTSRKPYSLGNGGIRIHLPVGLNRMGERIALLNCSASPNPHDRKFVSILLRKVTTTGGLEDEFARIGVRTFREATCNFNSLLTKAIYVNQDQEARRDQVVPKLTLQLATGPSNASYFATQVLRPPGKGPRLHPQSRRVAKLWLPKRTHSSFAIDRTSSQLSGALVIERDGEAMAILLGSLDNAEVGFHVVEWANDHPATFESLRQGFRPLPATRPHAVGCHLVRFSVATSQWENRKWFLVGLEITSYGSHKEALEGADNLVQWPGGEIGAGGQADQLTSVAHDEFLQPKPRLFWYQCVRGIGTAWAQTQKGWHNIWDKYL